MEHHFRLKIGRIVWSVEDAKLDESNVEKTLRQVMEILVRRLERVPVADGADLQRLVFSKLELEPLSNEEMFSSRGVQRLADDLYQQIIGGR